MKYGAKAVTEHSTVEPMALHMHIHIPYSGKHLREKTFTNFTVLEPPVKVLSTKFGCAKPTYDKF